MTRTRADRCPGVLRPWHADDGDLLRVRLPGGRLSAPQLGALADISEQHADGRLWMTSRANVQLRGIDSDIAPTVAAMLERGGLLPSRSHDLVRNILCSPLTGRSGGLADLTECLGALDRALCADAGLAALPGKFLFALDDGRGDLAATSADVAARMVSARSAEVVVGGFTAAREPLDGLPAAMLRWARTFLAVRGVGGEAAWHVRELDDPRGILGLGPPTPPRPAPQRGKDLVRQHDERWAQRLHIGQEGMPAERARAVASFGHPLIITIDRDMWVVDLPEPIQEER